MTCSLSPHFAKNLKLCRAVKPWHSLYWSKKPFSTLRARFKFKPPIALYGSTFTTNNLKAATFQGKDDRYEGVTVLSEHELCETAELSDKIKNSLEMWKALNKRGVWFRVHINQSDWVPILVKHGFKYHHAKGDYVMLYLWLSSEESDNTPSYAHTMIGVGAVVENNQDQILVVKEKYQFYNIPLWKLPGGHVEPGEELVDAALREVFEETGIKSEFQSILTIRQGHNGIFGCSDIYVVVNLKALNYDIRKSDREIVECKWMHIKEYLTHPHIHELNRFFVSRLLHHRKHNLKIDCHHGVHEILKKPFTIYSVIKADDLEEMEKLPFSSPTKKLD